MVLISDHGLPFIPPYLAGGTRCAQLLPQFLKLRRRLEFLSCVVEQPASEQQGFERCPVATHAQCAIQMLLSIFSQKSRLPQLTLARGALLQELGIEGFAPKRDHRFVSKNSLQRQLRLIQILER